MRRLLSAVLLVTVLGWTAAAAEAQHRLSVACGQGGFIHGAKQYATGRAIDCGEGKPRCDLSLPEGVYILTADPKPNHAIRGWGGACGGKETTCAFTLNRDMSVGAQFDDLTTRVTVEEMHDAYIEAFDAAKRESGDSTRLLACGWDSRINRHFEKCSATVTRGTKLVFYKFPREGAKPYFWKNICAGSDRVYCEVTASSNITAAIVPSIKVAVASPANGTVSFQGKSCPGACSLILPPTPATSVTFTAAPAAGYILGSWSGACAGTQGLTCTRTASGDLSVAAVFSKLH